MGRLPDFEGNVASVMVQRPSSLEVGESTPRYLQHSRSTSCCRCLMKIESRNTSECLPKFDPGLFMRVRLGLYLTEFGCIDGCHWIDVSYDCAARKVDAAISSVRCLDSGRLLSSRRQGKVSVQRCYLPKRGLGRAPCLLLFTAVQTGLAQSEMVRYHHVPGWLHAIALE